MVVDLLAPILDLVATYGLVAVFFFLVLDAAMLLPVLPGELLMIIAVQKFAPDRPALMFVVLLASTAATVGNLLFYGICRGGGRRLVEAHPRLFLMSPERRDRLEKLFHRPLGQSLVLFLRFFPFTRILVSLPAGLAGMPWIRYVVLSFLGNLPYHAAIMFLAFEARRPDSAVATQAATLKEAYANPAWAYVQANWVLVGLATLALAVILSLRASIKAARRPGKHPSSSLLGSLGTAVLFWGGAAILVGLWMEPPFVFDTISITGYDLRTTQLGLPYEPLSLAGAMGTGALLLGFVLASFSRNARRRPRHERLSSRIPPAAAGRARR